MLLKLIIFFFSNMYCGASEMFLNPGSGDARGEDSYWSSIPFWMRSGMWFILIIFSVFWSVIRVVIFSRWFYIFIVLMRNGSLFHCSRDFNILGCISTSVGNSVNGERIMTNWKLSQVKASLCILSIFNQLLCIWCQKCLEIFQK